MAFWTGLRESIAGWVHVSVRPRPVECDDHVRFIEMRLAVALLTLILVPPYLALLGAPAVWDVIAFTCALAPAAAIPVLSRTGRLDLAHAISMAGLASASLALALGFGGLSSAAMAWLVLVPFEAALSGSLVLLMSAGLLASLVLAMVALVSAAGGIAVVPSLLAQSVFLASALAYGLALSLGAIRAARARAALAETSRLHSDTLIEALGDLVLQQDRSGAVIATSRVSDDLLGLSARDLLGRGLFERILVQDRPAFLKAVADACDRPQTAVAVIRLRTGVTRDAGAFEEPVFAWVEMRVRRMEMASGELRALSVLRDITREHNAEVAREDARDEAHRTQAWKDRFLANVSHELRTPLNAIIGFSEMLGNEQLMPKDAEKRREYAGIIHSSGQHLLSVVNSILDMSKIEAGRFDILAEPFEVGPLIDSCCDILSLKAEQAGVRLLRDYPARIEELVADKRACRQILLNLLSNALKFTPRDGRIKIGVRPEGNMLAFFVADNGIGIPDCDLPRLGDAFFQASSNYDRTHEGTGLGLSVVRGLVGLHGGSISIESREGEGTCVTVRLPLDCRSGAEKRSSVPIEIVSQRAATPRHEEVSIPRMVKKIA